MRASRILVGLIVANVLLGFLAASVVLSREYAAIDAAVRKGKTLPKPPPEAARVVMARPEWKQEIVKPCNTLCRARSAVILRLYSEEELLRAYIASKGPS